MKLLTFKEGGIERLGWLQADEKTVLSFPIENELGNNHEATTAIGPVVVTKDEFDIPDEQTLKVVVDSQDVLELPLSNVKSVIERAAESLSATMALEPGDIICAAVTGSDDIEWQQETISLSSATIEVSISKLATMRNQIKPENTDRNPVACSC